MTATLRTITDTNTDTALAKSTALEKLRIEEVSGVDDPANGVPGFLFMKAAGFHPDDPHHVVTGDRPDYGSRQVDPAGDEEYAAAVGRLVDAFEESEGRAPTGEDANFITAAAELYEHFFTRPAEGRGSWTPAPVQKSSTGMLAWALAGERVVAEMADDAHTGFGNEKQLAKRRGLDGQEAEVLTEPSGPVAKAITHSIF